jgi:hypothetical protein
VIGWVNEGVGQAEAMQNVPPGLAHPMRKFWSFLESLAGCMHDGWTTCIRQESSMRGEVLSKAWLDMHGTQTKGSCS